MLLQEGQKAPFDISDFGIIFYKDSIGLEQDMKKAVEKYLDKLDDSVCDSPVTSILNSRAYNKVEKKLEEMEKLIWRLGDEVPRDNDILEKDKVIRNRILWVDDYLMNNQSVFAIRRI